MTDISPEGLERKLQQLPRAVRGRPLALAIRRALGLTVSPIRNATPIDTGVLRASVSLRVRRARGFGRGARFVGMTGRVGFRYPRGAHANLLELGTKNPDGSTRIEAMHFVRDTFRSLENQVEERFAKELLSLISKELKKL